MATLTRGFTQTYSTTMVYEECCSCGIPFGIPKDFRQQCLNDRGFDGKAFYCPNGHKQWYTGKTQEQKDRDEAVQRAKNAEEAGERARHQLRITREELKAMEHSRNGMKGALVSTQNRAKKAMCPAPGCKRHFVNVAKHIAGQHPDYVPPVPE